MFNQRGRGFAFQFEGGREQWTPPWLREEHHHHHHHGHHHRGPGARFFGMRMKRGLFGPGGPFGPNGPFGPEGPLGPEGKRFFGRGDVKYALLKLLQERPMHGYEMMKALEEQSGGFYAPSAGTIYPTLQMLEDRGLVTVQEQDGKKVYSITDSGRAFLAEKQKEEETFEEAPWARDFGPRGRWNSPEIHALRTEAMEVARLFAIAGRSSFRDNEKITRLRGIIERTRKELTDFIYGTNEQPKTSETPEQQGQP